MDPHLALESDAIHGVALSWVALIIEQLTRYQKHADATHTS